MLVNDFAITAKTLETKSIAEQNEKQVQTLINLNF